MTAGFSSWRFTESVDLRRFRQQHFERHLFKFFNFYLVLKDGIGILIFWISFSKLKEDGDFRISFTSRVGISTNWGALSILLLLPMVISLAEFSFLWAD
jgi:hypothetical protein